MHPMHRFQLLAWHLLACLEISLQILNGTTNSASQKGPCTHPPIFPILFGPCCLAFLSCMLTFMCLLALLLLTFGLYFFKCLHKERLRYAVGSLMGLSSNLVLNNCVNHVVTKLCQGRSLLRT